MMENEEFSERSDDEGSTFFNFLINEFKIEQIAAPRTSGSMCKVGHSEDALTRIRNIDLIELGR